MSRLQHARILRDRHRPEDALKLLMEELAENPNQGFIHHELCLTHLQLPRGGKSALEHARMAISLDPDCADSIALEAHALNHLERHAEALTAADRALAMDADVLMGWIAKSFAYGGLENWRMMEQTARAGLAIYPDDESLSHALANALRLQGRLRESAQVVDGRLARNPDNDTHLANAGWVALHAGRRDEAEKLFLAALAIDPETEYARSGLREAYKARSLLYRGYLKLSLRMAAVPERTRTMIFFGMFIAYKVLAGLAKQVHPLLGGLVVALWLGFVFWAHVVESVMHAILLKDRVARHSLKRREKLDGLIAASLIGLALVLTVAGWALQRTPTMMAGLLSLATLVVASHVALNRRAGMLVYGSITLVALVCIAASAVGSSAYFWLGITAVFLSTWLSFVPALNKPADDDD